MAVAHATLKKLAGCVWLAIGGMLAWRGLGMIFGDRADGTVASTAGIVASLGLGLF